MHVSKLNKMSSVGSLGTSPEIRREVRRFLKMSRSARAQ